MPLFLTGARATVRHVVASRRALFVVLFLSLVSSACGRSEQAVLDEERRLREEPSPTITAPVDTALPLVRVATHPKVPLTVGAPADWTDELAGAWPAGNGEGAGENIGQALLVAPDAEAFNAADGSGWDAPGIFAAVSVEYLDQHGVDTSDDASFYVSWASHVAQLGRKSSCEYGGASEVSLGDAYAISRLWTDCGNGTATVADFWSADPLTGTVVHVMAVVPDAGQVSAVRSILASVTFEGSPVVEFQP